MCVCVYKYTLRHPVGTWQHRPSSQGAGGERHNLAEAESDASDL